MYKRQVLNVDVRGGLGKDFLAAEVLGGRFLVGHGADGGGKGLSLIHICFNNAVLAEAAMSYLSIGVSPDEASLGYKMCIRDSPGLGRLLLTSIEGRDEPVARAIVVLLAFAVILCNLAADLLARRIDPRLGSGAGGAA